MRIPGPSWIDYAEDRAKAERLLALGRSAGAAQLIETVLGNRPGWTRAQIARRTRQILEGPPRLRIELDDWLRPCVAAGGPVLDLGCGAGQLLAALALSSREAVGVDVSVEWLIVADRLISELAEPPQLVAALAEALPFGDGELTAVISLDVIEHVADQGAFLREINRVLAPGGSVALTTPNRFSVAAEPHVGLWGVGWLPRAWQKAYVARRTHLPYEFVRLLSYAELQRLFRRHTNISAYIRVAPIPESELIQFRARRASLGRFYNALVRMPAIRWLLRGIGPFFHVIGQKLHRDGAAQPPA